MPIFSHIRAVFTRWQPWTIVVAIVLVFFALACWQHREYLHEHEQARESLQQQAHTVADVLVGGVRGHRNRGAFFADQIQGSLDGIVEAPDILAVAIVSPDGQPILSAGEAVLLESVPSSASGHYWGDTAYYYVRHFDLAPAPGGQRGRTERGRGGRGWGNRRTSEASGTADSRSSWSAGGQFTSILIFDRARIDAHIDSAAWLRVVVVLAGVLVLVCMGLVWRITVRSAARTRLLAAETRHLRDLGQAAAGLAHETRNPLGLIRGWAQRIVQSDMPVIEPQPFEAIVEECDRVTSRINQFLAFARPATPSPEPVRLKEVLDELTLLLEPDLQAKNVTVFQQNVNPEQTIQADRELLRQVLFNLIQNAVQASPEGGTVETSIGRGQDGKWRIDVADRGDGVAAEAVESLFSPYFTTKSDGTGLGLAIVRQIANAHGWEAGYSRRHGGGAVFWLDRIDG